MIDINYMSSLSKSISSSVFERVAKRGKRGKGKLQEKAAATVKRWATGQTGKKSSQPVWFRPISPFVGTRIGVNVPKMQRIHASSSLCARHNAHCDSAIIVTARPPLFSTRPIRICESITTRGGNHQPVPV